MPTTTTATLSKHAIQQINSLGGPPIPTGLPNANLKVLMENRAAADAALSSYRIAAALASRHH